MRVVFLPSSDLVHGLRTTLHAHQFEIKPHELQELVYLTVDHLRYQTPWAFHTVASLDGLTADDIKVLISIMVWFSNLMLFLLQEHHLISLDIYVTNLLADDSVVIQILTDKEESNV